jgi:hypothetical protein
MPAIIFWLTVAALIVCCGGASEDAPSDAKDAGRDPATQHDPPPPRQILTREVPASETMHACEVAQPFGIQSDPPPIDILGQGARLPPGQLPEQVAMISEPMTGLNVPWPYILDPQCMDGPEGPSKEMPDPFIRLRGSPASSAELALASTPQAIHRRAFRYYEVTLEIHNKGLTKEDERFQVGLYPFRVHPEQRFLVEIGQENGEREIVRSWEFHDQSVDEIKLGYVLPVVVVKELNGDVNLRFRLWPVRELLHAEILFGMGWNGDAYTTTIGGPASYDVACAHFALLAKGRITELRFSSLRQNCVTPGPFLRFVDLPSSPPDVRSDRRLDTP